MAGDDRTIIAHFVADTAGFEEGAQQVEESSKAIEASTTGVAKSYEDMSKQLETTGASASGTFTLMDDGLQKTIVYTDDFQKQFSGVSEAWDNVTSSAASFGDTSKKTAESSQALNSALVISDEEADKAAKSFLGLDEETKNTKTATDEAKTSHQSFMQTLQEVQNIIQIIQLLGQVITALDKMDEAMKNSQIAFTYLTGSADEASKVMTKLNTSFAAQAFGTQPVDNAAQHLMMLGKSADEAQNVIEKVSDGLSAMGKDATNLDSISVELEKMKDESRITSQEMDNLVAQGLPAWDALAKGMGTDVATAQREVKDGAVQGSQAFNEMMIGLGQYTGAAASKANDLSSEWTRFAQNFAKVMQPVIDVLTKVLDMMNNFMEGNTSLNDIMFNPGNFGFNTLPSNLGIQPQGNQTGEMAGFASGGTDLPAGWRVVGEEGPELQWSQGGDTIIPSGVDPLDFLGMSGGSSVSSALSGVPSLTSSSLNALGDISLAGLTGGISGPLNLYLYFDSQQFAQYFIPQMANTMRAYFGVRR